jgi:hypothetical protein
MQHCPQKAGLIASQLFLFPNKVHGSKKKKAKYTYFWTPYQYTAELYLPCIPAERMKRLLPSCCWLKQNDSKQTDGGETQFGISHYLKPKMYALFNHEIYSDYTGTYRAKIKSKPARRSFYFVDRM